MANTMRTRLKELGEAIGRRETDAAYVLEREHDHYGKLTVDRLLILQPRWGRERMRRLLRRHFIHEKAEVRKLTERQRRVLAAELRRMR